MVKKLGVAIAGVVTLIFTIPIKSVYGQDPQFSQFYANSLYLNPGLTGNTTQFRAATTYRNQWPSIPGAFISYTAAIDYNFEEAKSGFGLLVTRDKAGSGGLSFTSLGLSYAYYVRLSRKLALRSGLRFSYVNRNVDQSSLVFGDQIARDGAPSSIENIDQGTSHLNIAPGFILTHLEKYWAGIAIDHINAPNYSLIGRESSLPLKISVHGGWNFEIKDNSKVSRPTILRLIAHYKTQLMWDQLDIGGYFERNGINFGMWYRGIPGIKSYEAGYPNNDALVLLFGFEISNDLRFGYSYDVTISRLVRDTGGAHEISLVYEPANQRRKRRKRRFLVPCAKF